MRARRVENERIVVAFLFASHQLSHPGWPAIRCHDVTGALLAARAARALTIQVCGDRACGYDQIVRASGTASGLCCSALSPPLMCEFVYARMTAASGPSTSTATRLRYTSASTLFPNTLRSLRMSRSAASNSTLCRCVCPPRPAAVLVAPDLSPHDLCAYPSRAENDTTLWPAASQGR